MVPTCLTEVEVDVLSLPTFTSPQHRECLDAFWFPSMADACQRVTEWRVDCIAERLHPVLGNLTSSIFAAQLKSARKVV